MIRFIIYLGEYFLIMPVLTVLHELGHSIFVLALTNSDVYLEIGNNNLNVTKKIGRLNLKFKGYKNLFSITFGMVRYELFKSKITRICILLGGPLISLAIFILAILIKLSADKLSLGLSITLNSTSIYSLFQFLITILPIKYKHEPYNSMVSDGYQILQIIKESKVS